MSASSTCRLLGRTVLLALLVGAASCGAPPVRIPLAVPLPTVGGSRPATPQGIQLSIEFGDGVVGQEQERVELVSFGAAFAVRDRFEFGVSGYDPTRETTDAATTVGVRAKMRLGDFSGGKASVGLHIAYMGSHRVRFDVQNERLAAWDIALPVTFYPVNEQFIDHRWAVYAGPRLVFQTFEDRMTSQTSKGTLAAALVGVTARWRHVAVTGEMNLARTPSMSFATRTFQGGWIVLPMVSVSGIIPLED